MVTEPMVLVRIGDIGAYAEARALRSAVETLFRARGSAARGSGLVGLRLAARGLSALIVEALRARSALEEIRALREAATTISDLRLRVWTAFQGGELDNRSFDELMALVSRCRLDVDRWESHTRHRAKRQIDRGG
jgi:hypothetical protein